MTKMYSLAVLDSSVKSRCQQGCTDSGGFRGKSVSVPFQLLEAAYIPWLGVPPSHQSNLLLLSLHLWPWPFCFPLKGQLWLHLEMRIASYLVIGSCLLIHLPACQFSLFITTAIVIFLKHKLNYFIPLLTIVWSLPFLLHLKATVFTVACEWSSISVPAVLPLSWFVGVPVLPGPGEPDPILSLHFSHMAPQTCQACSSLFVYCSLFLSVTSLKYLCGLGSKAPFLVKPLLATVLF